MLKNTIALSIAAIIIVSCGEDDKKADVIDAKYQGTWQSATLTSGATNPTAEGCRIFDTNHSRTSEINLNASQFGTKTTYKVNSKLCDGSSGFSVSYLVNMVSVDKKDDFQVLGYKDYTVTVTIDDIEAAALFRTKSVCGKTDWQITTYTKDSEHLKGCTDENGANILFKLETTAELDKRLIRLKRQGDGLAFGAKNKDQSDDEFDLGQSYYAKK